MNLSFQYLPNLPTPTNKCVWFDANNCCSSPNTTRELQTFKELNKKIVHTTKQTS